MTEEIKEETAVENFEKLYAEQYQRCSIIGWNLAIYLNQFNIDLSSLPDPVADSLRCMVACRKIVEAVAHEPVVDIGATSPEQMQDAAA